MLLFLRGVTFVASVREALKVTNFTKHKTLVELPYQFIMFYYFHSFIFFNNSGVMKNVCLVGVKRDPAGQAVWTEGNLLPGQKLLNGYFDE